MINIKKGFTLIEVVVFITLAGLLAGVAVIGVGRIVSLSTFEQQAMVAEAVAAERMELLLGQKRLYGYYRFRDPCDDDSLGAICPPVNEACLVDVEMDSVYRGGSKVSVVVSRCGDAKLTTFLGRY